MKLTIVLIAALYLHAHLYLITILAPSTKLFFTLPMPPFVKLVTAPYVGIRYSRFYRPVSPSPHLISFTLLTYHQ